MTTVGLLLLVLFLLGVNVVVVLIIVLIHRRSRLNNERLALTNYYFRGSPEVALRLTDWRIGVGEIRRTAQERAYVEVPSPTQGVVVFRLAPPSAQRAVVAQPAVAWQPTAKHRARAIALEQRLSGPEPCWVRLRDVGWSMHDMESIAYRHGRAVARVLGQRDDPVVLLSRTSIAHIADTVGSWPTLGTSYVRHVLGITIALVGMMATLATANAIVDAGIEAPPALAMALSSLVFVPAAIGLLFPYVYVSRDITRRMTLLMSEFRGAPEVKLLHSHYQLPGPVIDDVAREFGYRHDQYWGLSARPSKLGFGWTVYTR